MKVITLVVGLVVLGGAGVLVYQGMAKSHAQALKYSVPQPSDTVLGKEWTPEQLGSIFGHKGQAFIDEVASVKGAWTPGEPGWDIGIENVGSGWVKAVYSSGGVLNSGWALMVYLPDTNDIKVGDHIRVQGRIYDISTTFVAGVPMQIIELKPGRRLDAPQ